MRFSTILSTLAAAGTAVATYDRYHYKSGRYGNCIPVDEVEPIVDNYVALVSDISSLSDEDLDNIMADDFVDWSNSISAFFGAPYDVPVFPTKESFITAQRNARQTPITIESIPAFTCDTIIVIFNGQFPNTTGVPSRGIAILTMSKEDEKFKISRVDVEFNSLAWAAGLGGAYRIFDQEVGELCPAEEITPPPPPSTIKNALHFTTMP